MPTREHPSGRLFTLIELLVVVAILSVLMSMLLPSLSSARDTAKRISCAGNMKQLGAATIFYVNDYNDWMAECEDSQRVGMLNLYMSFPPDKGSFSSVICQAWYSPKGPFFCPATEPFGTDPIISFAYDGRAATTSYGITSMGVLMSGVTVWGGWSPMTKDGSGAWNTYKRFQQITPDSAILGDAHLATTNWSLMNPADLSGPASTRYLLQLYSPNYHHPGRSANFLFTDGHVKAFKWTGATLFGSNWEDNKGSQ